MRLFAPLLAALSFAAHATDLNDTLDRIVNRYSAQAHVGVVVMNAKTGKVMYSRNASRYFQPASNTKLLTAFSGLASLGPKFTFDTELKAPAQPRSPVLTGPLYVQFSGDPSLTQGELVQLLHTLKSKGIKSIQGDVVIDNTVFSGANRPMGTKMEDMNWWYAAPANSININKNVVGVTFKAADQLGVPPKIYTGKNGHMLKIDNQMKTQAPSVAKLCPMEVTVDHDNVAHFTGCWSIDLPEGHERIALNNTMLPVISLVRDQLKRDGIELNGVIHAGKTPATATVIASHESKPLLTLLERMLGRSDNLYADSILKMQGVKRYQIGTFDAGVASEKATLKSLTTLDVDSMKITDGSGFDDLVTPMQLSKLLYAVYQDSNMFSYFKKTLSLSGVRGTIRNRMKSKLLLKKVYAKTGTLRDVSSLSGFLLASRGKHYIFSIISNNNNDGKKAAHRMENSIIDAIARMG